MWNRNLPICTTLQFAATHLTSNIIIDNCLTGKVIQQHLPLRYSSMQFPPSLTTRLYKHFTHTYTVLMYTRIGHTHKHKTWVTKYFSLRCHTIQMAGKYMQYVFLRHTAARFPSTTENSPSQFSATSRSPPTRHSGSYYRPPLHLPPFIQAFCLSRTRCTKHLPSHSSPPTRWQPLSELTARYCPLLRLTAEFIHGSPPCSHRRILHFNLLMGSLYSDPSVLKI
jgi:hypothetical protein